MSVFWAALAGNAVALSVLGTLFKYLIESRIKKDQAAHAESLRRETSQNLAEIKATFDAQNKQAEIHESWLHERKASALEELFLEADSLKKRIGKLGDEFFGPREPDEIREYTDETWRLLRSFLENFDNKRIFLSEATCQRLWDVFEVAQESINHYLAYVRTRDDDELAGLTKVREEVLEGLREKVAPAVELLVHECRKIYGVTPRATES